MNAHYRRELGDVKLFTLESLLNTLLEFYGVIESVGVHYGSVNWLLSNYPLHQFQYVVHGVFS